MKTKLSQAVVGSFVIGALALIVAALLSFRSSHLFSKPGRFVAYFNESVQGLDVGGAVKLRGVRAGRVVAIRVHYDSKARQSQVAVVGELGGRLRVRARFVARAPRRANRCQWQLA